MRANQFRTANVRAATSLGYLSSFKIFMGISGSWWPQHVSPQCSWSGNIPRKTFSVLRSNSASVTSSLLFVSTSFSMLGGNPIKEASFSDELVVVAFRYSPIIEVTRELAIFSRASLGTPL
jgi:hypothetical protein